MLLQIAVLYNRTLDLRWTDSTSTVHLLHSFDVYAVTESNIVKGNYFASKTLEDIGLHEVGHIFAVENKLNGVAIAKKAYYSITGKHISTKYLRELLSREISANAADQTVEIIAEMFVAERNNPTEFVKQFMALIRTGNML